MIIGHFTIYVHPGLRFPPPSTSLPWSLSLPLGLRKSLFYWMEHSLIVQRLLAGHQCVVQWHLLCHPILHDESMNWQELGERPPDDLECTVDEPPLCLCKVTRSSRAERWWPFLDCLTTSFNRNPINRQRHYIKNYNIHGRSTSNPGEQDGYIC